MAMSSSGTGSGPQSDINMTPMIDVLLVLLIIFLVIQPALQRGIKVEVPAVRQVQTQEQPEQVVLRVGPGPSYFVNETPVERAQIPQALETALEGSAERVVFVTGAESLTYGEVVAAIDAARRTDIQMIGLLPRSEAGRFGGSSP